MARTNNQVQETQETQATPFGEGTVEETTGTEMVVVKADIGRINLNDLKSSHKNFLSTLPDDDTRASKAKIFNAIQSPEHTVEEFIGKTLEIVHLVGHEVSLVDEKTGEVVETARMILIDKDGKGYSCVSVGIFSALKNLSAIVGNAPWVDEPLKVEVIQQKTRNGNNKVLSLKLV
jgi:hypothetical protein